MFELQAAMTVPDRAGRWRAAIAGAVVVLATLAFASPTLGIGVHVLQPGEPSAMYHAESEQEGFLVLAGECLAIVEGQERRMRTSHRRPCARGHPGL